MGTSRPPILFRARHWNPPLKLGTGEHTVRDKSQVGGSKKDSKDRVLMEFYKNGSFSIRNEWSPIRQSDLIECSQEWRIPAHYECS
jgi:hypothetical protein